VLIKVKQLAEERPSPTPAAISPVAVIVPIVIVVIVIIPANVTGRAGLLLLRVAIGPVRLLPLRGGRCFGHSGSRWGHVLHRPLYKLVQLSPVEPNAPAFGAVIYLDTLPVGNF
jgi:hypothetical protein